MNYLICCQVFFVLVAIGETIKFGSPRLVPQLRIGRSDNGISLELGTPRLSPMFRVGKRMAGNDNENQNDEAYKRSVNGLLPFMRTGRANNFDVNNKNSVLQQDAIEDYQKFFWYYIFLKDALEKQTLNYPTLSSSEKEK